jgi:hypothetical protein
MNPYLENPAIWQEFHNRLIVAIADDLAPKLRPKYRAAVERRVYEDAGNDLTLIGRPDTTVFCAQSKLAPITPPLITATGGTVIMEPVMVEVPMPEEIKERYLEIRDVLTSEVVTTLELISPSNKRPGKGRSLYEEKRLKILGSFTHLVEIDLIRAFTPLPFLGNVKPSLYRILISRAQQRPRAALYPFNLSTPIPVFSMPLKPEDPEPLVDLQALVHQVYDRAAYDLEIDYRQDPVPPLSDEDGVWLETVLNQQELR